MVDYHIFSVHSLTPEHEQPGENDEMSKIFKNYLKEKKEESEGETLEAKHSLSSNRFKCNDCDFFHRYSTEYENHKNTGCYKYKCPACSFKTSLRSLYLEHQPRTCKMNNDPEDQGHAVCEKCDYRANTFGQLKAHKDRERCYKYFCKYCPFRTSMTKGFTEHRVYRKCRNKTRWNQVKYKITNNLAKGRYPCKSCDYKGNSFANLLYHRTNSTCFRYKCQRCDFKTSVIANLKEHKIQKLHFYNMDNFACKDCDYQGIDSKTFGYHMKKGCWRFKCLKCSFKTAIRENFKEHKANEGDDHIHKRWNESMRKKIKSYNESKVKIEKPIIDYTCLFCDYKGTHLFKFKQHKRFGCFKWTCRKCQFRSSLQSKFKIHKMETKHEQRAPLDAYSCITCDFKTDATSKLRKHKQSLKGCFRFKCNLNCSFKTSVIDKFQIHRVSHGLGEGKTKGIFACLKCDYTAKDLTMFLKHEGNCNRFSCNVCTFKTSMQPKLKEHRIKEQHYWVQVIKYKYNCSKCDYKCKLLNSLRKHNQEKNGCNKFKCAHCSFMTSMSSAIEKHTELCFQDYDNFNCSTCDYKAENKKCLLKHKQKGCYKFICLKCEFKTSIVKTMNAHKKNYHNISSYDCPKCDYTIKARNEQNQSAQKKRHEQTGCFKFSCLSCDYKTSIPNTMIVHRGKTHSKRNDKDFYKDFKKSFSDAFTIK